MRTAGIWRLTRALMMAALLIGTWQAASLRARAAIAVRVGEHAGFDRLVFDWESRVDYRVEQRGDSVTVTFDSPTDIDLRRLHRDPPPLVLGATASSGGDRAVVHIQLSRAARLRHFYIGSKTVFDFYRAPADLETAPEVSPETISEPEREGEPSAEAVAQAGSGSSGKTPTPAGETPTSAGAGDPDPAPATSDRVEPAHRPAEGVLVAQMAAIEGGARIVIPWTSKVAAAVFTRAGYLWAVFSKAQKLDLAALAAGGTGFEAEQIVAPGATVLRLRAGDRRHATARRSGMAWEIDLTEQQSPVRTPLQIMRREKGGGESSVFLPVAGAGVTIEIVDPEVGDLMMAIPVSGDGYGVLAPARRGEYEVLASAQGVAVVPLSDRVVVTPGLNGITISTVPSAADSLRMAADDPSRDGGVDAPADGGEEGARPAGRRLVDFKAWRRGPRSRFNVNRLELLRALVTAPASERNDKRLDLARFHAAHGQAQEALGLLDLVASSDSLIGDRPDYRAVRGIVEVMAGRYREAVGDLEYSALAAEPHVFLWRSLAAEALKRPQEAVRFFRRGIDVLWEYSDEDQARFRLAAARAGLLTQDYKLVRRELATLESAKLGRRYNTEVELIRGRMYEVLGDHENALASFDKVIKANYRPTRAIGAFMRTNVLYGNGDISRDEAIENLEGLRFAWRGGDFELALLQRLGDLYFEKGDYRAGLGVSRLAVSHFAKSDKTGELAARMTKVFRRLFLDGEADKLSAVNALALYYDFRELTPIGAAGDDMIRRLAERLVGVDLLDRAAALLTHQIKFRLKGIAQAQVATRLAVIHLLNRKPAKALDIIAKTEQPRLPEELDRRRLHLEVRALTKLARYDEAEDLLEGDTSPEAEALRDDLHWDSGQWAKLAVDIAAKLAERWRDPSPLAPSERFQVLRLVVALAFDDDADGLTRVREQFKPLMAGGPFDRSFDVITSELDFDGVELRELVGQLADVSIFEEFLANYRNELGGRVLSAMN